MDADILPQCSVLPFEDASLPITHLLKPATNPEVQRGSRTYLVDSDKVTGDSLGAMPISRMFGHGLCQQRPSLNSSFPTHFFVASGKLPSLPEPQFPILQNGNNNSNYFREL